TITLIVELDGCQSDPFTAMVEVVEPMTAPEILCSATENEVLFEWTPPPGVTGVLFDVTPMGYPGMQNGDTYTVSGVPVNTDVSLTVTFQLSGPCGNLVSTTE